MNTSCTLFTIRYHKLRTAQNKTPEQLWLQGMLQAHGSGWREVQAIYDHPDNITDWSQYHK